MKKKFRLGHASGTLYGKAGKTTTQIGKIYELGRLHGADNVFIIDTPVGPSSPGYHRVIATESEYRLPIVQAEGGVCPPGKALLLPTRDCPAVAILNRKTQEVGMVHAGRNQLINVGNPCQLSHGTIERLITALHINDGQQASAYVTGGISARHFAHDDPSYIQPFIHLYGPSVVENEERMTLDMLAIIKRKLDNYGITDVECDGLCTYETYWLGSQRAERAGVEKKKEANWAILANPLH